MSRFYTSFYVEDGHVLLRGIEDGERINHKIPLKPYVFTAFDKNADNLTYRTLDGTRVAKFEFDSPKEAYLKIKEWSGISNFKYYGMTNWVYPFINDYYPGQVDFDKSLIREGFIDIEVAADEGFPDIQAAAKEITAITILCNGFYYAFGCHPFIVKDMNIKYYKCSDEIELIKTFLTVWKQLDLDVVSGWNVEFFDIPYLVNRIKNLLSSEEARSLSPWGLVYEREVEVLNKTQRVYDVVGINVCDYLQIYRKFSFKVQESYKLNYIAHQVLGEKKLDYSHYDSLIDLYRRNFQLFMEYNIQDTGLVKRIDDKEGLLFQVYALAYDGKVAYADTLTTVRMWDVIIHNYLLERNIVVPQFDPSKIEFSIPGGFVKDPQCRLHKWIMSFDLTSLYPKLIEQYNISPETLAGRLDIPLYSEWHSEEQIDFVNKFLNGILDDKRDQLVEQDVSATASSYLFSKEFQGFIPALMEKMFADRDHYKKLLIESKKLYEETKDVKYQNDIARYHNLQLSKKIQLNSCYGAMGNPYFRWFDPRLAMSITLSGQLSIRWIERALNKFMNNLMKTDGVDYVIAVDTDSIYLSMEKFVDKFCKNMSHSETIDFLDKAARERIEKYIDKSYNDLASYMNAYSQQMKMKREVIADKGIWTAKKRYILSVWDSEGVRYQNYEMKIMGMETQRSSVPEVCRASIKKVYELVLHDTEAGLQEYLAEFKKKFYTLPFEDIAFPRGVNGLKKYYNGSVKTGLGDEKSVELFNSKTPVHVRGAIQYNRFVKEKKLDQRYPPIQEGDKIRFSYLRLPNPLNDKVISCPDTMPRQLGLDRYIDYDIMYDKTFLSPVMVVLDKVGWQPEKRFSLEDIFD